MKDNTVTVFLPTRAGSERIKNKNTRSFAGNQGGLLLVKINQLLSSDLINEVVLSTNDETSIEVASMFKSPKLKVCKRPAILAQSDTNLVDLVDYVPSVCESKHILWTHVTSPFVGAENYDDAIRTYFDSLEKGYDSLMSVKRIQNFIWSKENNEVTNKKDSDCFKKWPRTQDLKEVFEVNSAIFLASKGIYTKEHDRIGNKPYLLLHNDLLSIDVDWEEDFRLAETLYNAYYEK